MDAPFDFNRLPRSAALIRAASIVAAILYSFYLTAYLAQQWSQPLVPHGAFSIVSSSLSVLGVALVVLACFAAAPALQWFRSALATALLVVLLVWLLVNGLFLLNAVSGATASSSILGSVAPSVFSWAASTAWLFTLLLGVRLARTALPRIHPLLHMPHLRLILFLGIVLWCTTRLAAGMFTALILAHLPDTVLQHALQCWRYWYPLALIAQLAWYAWMALTAHQLHRSAVRIGKCPSCGYSLSGLQGTTCPECGTTATTAVA